MYYDYNKGLPGAYGSTMLKRTASKFKRYKELYPGLLTMVLFAIFGSPMITGYRMYADPNVSYWVGDVTAILGFIPVFLIVGHIIQAYYGRPMFFPLLFMIVPPALLCLFVGYALYVPIPGIVIRLLSNDCVTFVEKWNVQQAYDNATSVFNDCAAIKAKMGNTTAEAVKAAGLILSDCKNYKPEGSRFEKEWTYLSKLEAKENCAGWCYNDEISLWRNNDRRNDACSSAAAAALNSRERSYMRIQQFSTLAGSMSLSGVRERFVSTASERMMLNGLMGFLVGGGAMLFINEWLIQAQDAEMRW